jgi:hypothetical protein
MANNFHRRLDRLERLMRDRYRPDTSPIYLRADEAIPEKIDPQHFHQASADRSA